MRRIFTLAFLGLGMALSSSGQLYAQRVQPVSYSDLLSRLEAVESTQSEGVSQTSFLSGKPSCRNSCKPRDGVYVTYETVWVTPFYSNNSAYEILDSIPNVGEDAQIVQFGSNFQHSSRIELGYIHPCSGIGWRARYWGFNTNNSVQVADPDPATGRIQVGLQDDPDIEASTGNDEFVVAQHTLNLDVLDLEVMIRRGRPAGELTLSGGLRYVRMRQNYRADFIADGTGVNPAGFTDDIIASAISFEGIGPTLALEGVRRLGVPGWSLFGNVRSSLAFGDSSLLESRVDPQTPAAPVRELVAATNDLDLQFIAEMQLGMQYERYLSNGMLFFTRLGAEAQYWPSGGSGAVMQGEDDGTTGDQRDSDMGFIGISASIGTNW